MGLTTVVKNVAFTIKNEAMALIFIGELLYGIMIVPHTSNGVFEFLSLNATPFNLKNKNN